MANWMRCGPRLFFLFGLLLWSNAPAQMQLPWLQEPMADQLDDPAIEPLLAALQRQGITATPGHAEWLNGLQGVVDTSPAMVAMVLAEFPVISASFRESKQPWVRAAGVLASHTQRRLLKTTIPASELQAELADPAPQLRATALMLLDVRDPAGRAALTAALADGAWVEPLTATVADHAYNRLTEVLDPAALLEIRRNPKHRRALNTWRGLRAVSFLRVPWATQDAAWESGLEQFRADSTPVPQGFGNPVLAGLWHKANEKHLQELLQHPNLDVRLTAFDALTERLSAADPLLPALTVALAGGSISQGDCVAIPKEAGTLAFEAAIEQGTAAQIRGFLLAMEDEAGDEQGPVELSLGQFEVAQVLGNYPQLAREQLPILRQWIADGVSAALRAIAVAADPADLPLLAKTMQAGSAFMDMRGRNDPQLLAAARTYYLERQDNRKRPYALRNWLHYVLSLEPSDAMPLLDLMFAESISAEQRRIELSDLTDALHRQSPPNIQIARFLWEKHRFPAPNSIAELLDGNGEQAENNAITLLTDGDTLEWLGPLPDKPEDSCGGRSQVILAALRHISDPLKLERLVSSQLTQAAPCELGAYVQGASSLAGKDTVHSALLQRIATAGMTELQAIRSATWIHQQAELNDAVDARIASLK